MIKLSPSLLIRCSSSSIRVSAPAADAFLPAESPLEALLPSDALRDFFSALSDAPFAAVLPIVPASAAFASILPLREFSETRFSGDVFTAPVRRSDFVLPPREIPAPTLFSDEPFFAGTSLFGDLLCLADTPFPTVSFFAEPFLSVFPFFAGSVFTAAALLAGLFFPAVPPFSDAQLLLELLLAATLLPADSLFFAAPLRFALASDASFFAELLFLPLSPDAAALSPIGFFSIRLGSFADAAPASYYGAVFDCISDCAVLRSASIFSACALE